MPVKRAHAAGEHESLAEEATHTLGEARMVLPGVQALFGFQLVAVYQQPFDRILSIGEQRLHLLAVATTAITIALLLAPVAFHRQADPHNITRLFVRLASLLLTLGMATLMISLVLDCYLTARIILHAPAWSAAIAAGIAIIFCGLWFVLPRLLVHRR